MTDEEKELLIDIDELYTQLHQSTSGNWIGTYLMPPSGYKFTHITNKINEKVLELYDEFHPEYLKMHNVDKLDHTCNKEVHFVEHHYDLSIKKNAAKKRHTEFIDSMHKPVRQIELDIFTLLQKIKEIRE